MAVGQTLSHLHVKKGKGRLRETRGGGGGGSRLSVIMTLTVGNIICESPLKQKQKWCRVPLEEIESGRGSSVAIDEYLTKNVPLQMKNIHRAASLHHN